jgi:Kef-type K+ transport system membrane component KefB
MAVFDLSVLLFLQLAVLLAVCRGVGLLMRRFGQPQVVSEMIAGVLLGPSLLGAVSPQVSAWLFPPDSRAILFALSQVGLVLYMFLIGLEFDRSLLRQRLRSAVAVSAAGIVVPFALGGLLAWQLVGDPALFSARTTPMQAVLFMGAAMAITAFPMLARIIHEQGLSRSALGTLALAAGAMDDAVAWCLLAVVLASFQGEPMIALKAIVGGVVFAVVCLTLLRPAVARWGDQVAPDGSLAPGRLMMVLALVMLGAWFTDTIRIYAVFGAFLVGMAMPRGAFAEALHRAIYPLTTVFLLPVFFVYSGLNTRIGLVDTPWLWALTGLVLLAATLGKAVACWAAARWTGQSQHDALAIGTLMNARGLMELIILNIGLQHGIIQPALFTILVLMAILTTLAATPVFEWLRRRAAAPLVLPATLLHEAPHE